MKTLFQKLKLENQQEILILNEPDGFVAQFQELVGIDVIESLILVNKVEFALVFVETIEEFESLPSNVDKRSMSMATRLRLEIFSISVLHSLSLICGQSIFYFIFSYSLCYAFSMITFNAHLFMIFCLSYFSCLNIVAKLYC